MSRSPKVTNSIDRPINSTSTNLIHQESFFQVTTERLLDMTKIACLQASSIHPEIELPDRRLQPSVGELESSRRLQYFRIRNGR